MSTVMYIMQAPRKDILVAGLILILAYARPCMLVSFFNTLIGRLILIAMIVAMSLVNTLWGVLGVLLLVSFRESIVEGLDSIKNGEEKDVTVQEISVEAHEVVRPDAAGAASKSESDAQKAQDGAVKKITPAEWRQSNCKGNKVMFDGAELNLEEMSKKFPEVEFLKGSCNPCLANCEFKVTTAGARVNAEEQIRSRDSNKLPSSK